MATGPDNNSPEQFQAIQTQWSLIARAHGGSAASIGQARNTLALRYRKAIRSYLGALLKEYERDHPGSFYYTLFKLRSESPSIRSKELAVLLEKETGRKVTAAAAHQSMHRARFLFAQYLVEEVGKSLTEPTAEAVEDEVAELGLIKYVRDVMPADWRTNGRLLVEEDK